MVVLLIVIIPYIFPRLLLMLIPFIRVAISLIYFATAKDLKYVFIIFIVLAILTISLSVH